MNKKKLRVSASAAMDLMLIRQAQNWLGKLCHCLVSNQQRIKRGPCLHPYTLHTYQARAEDYCRMSE